MHFASAASVRPLRIVIPGGSGHVGVLLAYYLQERGHHVTVLTRSPFAASWNTVHWDGEHTGPWTEHLEGADACINLAGRSVNCRYTPKNREAIYHSRVDTTQLLGDVIAGLADPPKVWLNASTATIYRHSPDRPMDEFTGELGGNEMLTARRRVPETWNFSIRVAMDWEAAFFAAFTPRTRKVAMRSAIVMSPEPGGPFALLLNLVRFSLGGAQGNGRQFVSWIHGLDFARAVEFLIANEEFDGPVNLAAPRPAAQSRIYGDAAGRMGDAKRSSCSRATARTGRGVSANRIRAGAEEPIRGAGAPAAGWVRVRIPHLGRSRRRSGAPIPPAQRGCFSSSLQVLAPSCLSA